MPTESNINQDIDIIAQRLRDELTAETIPANEVAIMLAQLSPEGSWPDIDYDDRARTHWSPGDTRGARLPAGDRLPAIALVAR